MAFTLKPLPLMFTSGVLVHGAYDAVRVLVSYRVINLGGGGAEVGLVAATFALVPLLLALRIGRWVDGHGSWGVMVVGGVLSLIACVGVLFSPTLLLLGLANALLGLGQVMTFLAGQGVIMENSPPEKFVNGFALFSLSVAVGQSIGTPLVGVLVEIRRASGPAGIVDVDLAMMAMVVAVALALPLMLLLPRLQGGDGRAQSSRPKPDMLGIARIHGMPAAVYASLVVLTGIDLITAYLPVVGEHYGIAPLTVTLLVALRSVFSMLSRAGMPLLMRIASGPTLLTAALAVSTPAIIAAAFTGNTLLLAVLMAVVGFCWGMSQPLSMNWVAILVDPSIRASALSLRLTGNRLAQVAVPALAGSLTGTFGPGAVFVTSGLLTGTAAVSTRIFFKEKPGEPEGPGERNES